jgi:hypothetical protein
LNRLGRLFGLSGRFLLRRLLLDSLLLLGRHGSRRDFLIRRSRVFRLGWQGVEDDMLDHLVAERTDEIHGTGNARLSRDEVGLQKVLVHDFAGISMDTGEGGEHREGENEKEGKETFKHLQGSFLFRFIMMELS